jgi:dynein light chain 1
MTSCKDAIKKWEEKTGESSADAIAVKLYAQNPPISKMDAALNGLDKCEHLSLSTNSIDRLIPLPGIKNLRILSIGRNCLKKIEKLDDVAGTLTEIWASYNFISNLDGLHNLQNLEVLYLSNNKIKDIGELSKLAGLPKLRDILLIGNPCYEGMEKAEQRLAVLAQLPNIAKIDGEMVTAADRGGLETKE